ncbi:MAG: guanylate kinase [Oscillospiraceae bacterium]|nr:guanylate kinase [Oscillospiraceae bacterium]
MNKEVKSEGMLVVLSAPSGCGKDTVLAELDGRVENLRRSVSMTTRKMRDDETDGADYFFVGESDFESKINGGEMLEYTRYNGHYYGTLKKPVDELLKKGETVVLKIEVEGAGKIRSMYPDAVTIFLVPPSMQTLEKRLRKRMSEGERDIRNRMAIAVCEIKHADSYDYIVVNDQIDYAVSDICSIIRAERLKTKRSLNSICLYE